MNYSPEEETADDLEIARKLVRDGWKQTSSKYRTIARLPEHVTMNSGLKALEAYDRDAYERIMEDAERRAADTFRRIYANEKDGTKQALDEGMWVAFKKAGGEASF